MSGNELLNCFKQTKIPFAILNETGNFEYINYGFSQITGYSEKELQELSFETFILKEQIVKAKLVFKKIINSEELKILSNISLVDKFNKLNLVDINIHPFLNGNKKKNILLIISNIKEMNCYNKNALNKYFDDNTGLPTKYFADIWLKNVIQDTKFSFFTIKLNYISSLNKSNYLEIENKLFSIFYYELLKILGERKVEIFKFSDNKIGVFLYNIIAEKQIVELAEFILNDRHLHIGKHVVLLNLSIGIYISEEHEGLNKNVLFKSELASEFCKNNQYKIYDVNLSKNMSILKLLKSAYDDNEFVIFYQPYVNLKNGKIKGFEALIRWKDKSGIIIPPGHFIPFLEENALMEKIEKRVLELVFSQIKTWESYLVKNNLKISINLSPDSFSQEKFIDLIIDSCDRSKINTSLICFEITEGSLIKNIETVIQNILKLKDLGFSISLDDFGTGYSSLSYLKNLNIDNLKIDKSFITNINKSKYEQKMLKAISDLATSLGINLIYEGIENKEQLDCLRKINKTGYYQGYYFSRPVTAEEITKNFLVNL